MLNERVDVIDKCMQNMMKLLQREGDRNVIDDNVQPRLLKERVAVIDKSMQNMIIGQDGCLNSGNDNDQPGLVNERVDVIDKSTQTMTKRLSREEDNVRPILVQEESGCYQ